MNQVDSMLRILQIIASFLTLQLFWFFFSLGAVTLIPATIAMYAVVLDWSKNGVHLGVWEIFIHTFEHYFKNTLILLLNVGIIATVLMLHTDMVAHITESLSAAVLQFIWIFGIGFFLLSFISVMPLVVSSHLKGRQLLKNALIASFSIFPNVLLIGLIGACFFVLAMYAPMLLISFMSIFAFFHIQIWQKGMKKLPQDFLDQCLVKYRYR